MPGVVQCSKALLLLLQEEDDDLESEYVNSSTFGSKKMGYVWQEERTTANGL